MSELDDTNKLLELLKAGQPKALTDVDRRTVRYALYARKSTTSEDRQASSIEDQIKDCMERLIVPDDLNVVKTYHESFSAKVANMRGQFNAMIREIENGRIDGVIAWHPDRLSRNMKEAGAIIDLVDRGLIRDLRFSTFTFENTPAGKMLLGITFVMAKQYSEHLSESVDRGNRRAVEGGEFIGKFKHGYVIDTNRTFQPDPHGFAPVKYMFEMALEGKSQKEIRTWINSQNYEVQKRPDGAYEAHIWSKDDVSKLLRDPHYAGVHKWGKNLINLKEQYDFESMVTVEEFLQINKIENLNSSKILTLHRPRNGGTRADLLRGMVYCAKCNQTLTSMLIDKKDPVTREIISSRYYYKCETEGCEMYGASARAGLVIEAAQDFFEHYLFTTENNFNAYMDAAKVAARQKAIELDSTLARLKITISNKEKAYEKTKTLVLNNPDLSRHYDLDTYAKEVEDLKLRYAHQSKQKDGIKASLPTYEQYLKLFQSTPVILGKIRDMKTMDTFLRIFFSNFTITPNGKDFRKGSKVSAKLKEPWNGFIVNKDFVYGAGEETLTLDLFLGKEAL